MVSSQGRAETAQYLFNSTGEMQNAERARSADTASNRFAYMFFFSSSLRRAAFLASATGFLRGIF
jgi:hypothetical protein